MYISKRILYIFVAVLALTLLFTISVLAGNINSPGAPTDPASQMYTLADINNRLNAGTVGVQSTFTEPTSGPGSTMADLNTIMAAAPAVDDTNGAAVADVANGKTFWGLTNGAWGPQTGTLVASANPAPPCFDNTNRYVDCGNGTVHDTVTNLIWLKNANCFGQLTYTMANNAAAGLADAACGLTDGSAAGDWRLPTKAEWEATIARAGALGCTNPNLTNTPGTSCYSVDPQPFTTVQSAGYWSGRSNETSPDFAWFVRLNLGGTFTSNKANVGYVWPVRVGQ